jgi:hypothetical protein
LSLVVATCFWLISGRKGPSRGFRRVFVGLDKRLSTSKAIASAWTGLIGIGLVTMIVTKWADHPQGFDATVEAGLAGQYGLLLGGPLGAATLAKGIVSSQAGDGSKTAAAGPRPRDLIANDSGDVDLGDFQYVLFNLIAMLFLAGSLIDTPQEGLPQIPDVLLGLTSVAAAGYVGKKALPTTPTVNSVSPGGVQQDAALTIQGSALSTGLPPAPPTVYFVATQRRRSRRGRGLMQAKTSSSSRCRRS